MIVISASASASSSAIHDYNAVLNSISKEEYTHCNNYPEMEDFSGKNLCAEYIYGINNQLNDLWWNSLNKDELVNFLDELWLNRSDLTILNNPLIKLNLAFLMGQTSWTTVECSNYESLRNYVVSSIKSNNIEIVASSVTALGVVGKSEDVALLKPIILSEQEGLAEKAVRTVVKLLKHQKPVNEFMKVILPDIQRESLRRYITRYIKNSTPSD